MLVSCPANRLFYLTFSKASRARLILSRIFSPSAFHTYRWRGYKLHLSTGDGGVILAAALTSASVHDSQAAIPLMQMTAERATVLYNLADSVYDAQAVGGVVSLWEASLIVVSTRRTLPCLLQALTLLAPARCLTRTPSARRRASLVTSAGV